jgi:hypothetical protein
MGNYKTQGLKNASHKGLTTRADHEKRHPPGFFVKRVQRCANQAMGISTTNIEGSLLQSQPNEIVVPHEKEPDLA